MVLYKRVKHHSVKQQIYVMKYRNKIFPMQLDQLKEITWFNGIKV